MDEGFVCKWTAMNHALSLPDSPMAQVKRLAKRDNVSTNQIMLSAIAEKTSALASNRVAPGLDSIRRRGILLLRA